MKQRVANKNVIAIIIMAVLVVAAAIGIGVGLNRGGKKTPISKVEYTFYKSKAERLDNHNDIGVMILDCDNEECFNGTLTNATVTSREGEYVQGTGALKVGSLASGKTILTSGYFMSADISNYEKGSIHVSLYVSDVKYVGGNINLELTSSGTCDRQEMCWIIPPSVLKSGWNDLYLGIEDAKITGGDPDLSKINYYRMYTSGNKIGLDVIMDCIYATDTPGMSLEPKAGAMTASTKAGYLMDCDTLEGVTSSGSLLLSTAKGEYKEGEAAIIVSNPKNVWISANLKQVDLSAYKNGKLNFWVYINDAAYVEDGTVNVELTSSGTFDKNEKQWRINGSDLKTGWNEMTLPFGTALNSTKDPIDFTKVNYLRIFGQKCDTSLLVILDAIRVIPAKTIVSTDGMILSCDSDKGISLLSGNTASVTTNAGEYKQEAGAFKSVGSKTNWWMVSMQDMVDISSYADGALHLWLYVSDTSRLDGKVNIELGSGGAYDVDEYQWIVGGLTNGWNELYLDFDSALVTGKPNLGGINWFRIFGKCNGEVTAIVDDVRAVGPVEESTIPGLIANCDSMRGVSLSAGAVTTIAGEYKEGVGAYITSSASNLRTQFTLKNTVDISEYTDGSLHLWLYIDNPSAIYKGFLVELGNDTSNFYRWIVAPGALQSGWNELFLAFENADLKYGDTNFKEIDYFRLLQYTSTDKSVYQQMTTIVDDIRAVEAEKAEDSQIPGMIANCDSTNGVKLSTGVVTTTEGQYTEGKGAYKLENAAANVRVYFTLNNSVDLSQYSDGTVCLDVYIDNPDNIYKNLIIELGNDWSQTYRWVIPKANLQSGWNELSLSFTDAIKVLVGEGITDVDITAIDFFRILQNSLAAGDSYTTMTTIVDNIRAVEDEKPDGGNEEEKPVTPGMVLDCDSMDNMTVLSNNKYSVTTDEYKEGTGAFKNEGKGTVWWAVTLNNPVDISAYADGGIHVWLYVSDASKLTSVINIEIGSAGTWDKNEYQWLVDGLQSGWNELYLDLTNPNVVKDGEPDFTKINWFRVYASCSADIVAMVDDVRAVEARESEDDNEEEKPVTSVTITDCDTTDGLTLTKGELTTTIGRYKEGKGAYIHSVAEQVVSNFTLSTPINLTEYVDGSLYVDVYVDNTSKIYKNLIVELGNAYNQTYRWVVPKAYLNNGWNELCLSIENATIVGTAVDNTQVDFFRILQNSLASGDSYTAMTTIVDNVRVEKTQSGLVIADCDTTDGLTLTKGELTTTIGRYKEGKGAYIHSVAEQVVSNFTLSTPINLTEYVDGSLYVDVYVDNTSKIYKNLIVELGNAYNQTYRWVVPKAYLNNGWNELCLSIENATIVGTAVDNTQVDFFRILQNSLASGDSYTAMTTIVDNVRVEKTQSGLVIADCDTTDGLTLTKGELTTTIGRYKEGKGAYIHSVAEQVVSNFTLSTPINLTEYVDGSLYVDVYVDNTSKIYKNLIVELGNAYNQTYRWVVPKAYLNNGWNELCLSIENATIVGTAVDNTQVDFFRILQNSLASGDSYTAMTTIVDDIRVIDGN